MCDDGSSDMTLSIISQFRRRSQFPVQIVENPTRLGPYANFLRAAMLCSGRVIAFCDQDDVWDPRKLDRCVREFDEDNAVTLVVHSGTVIGARNRLAPRAYPAYRRRRAMLPGTCPLAFPAPRLRDSLRARAARDLGRERRSSRCGLWRGGVGSLELGGVHWGRYRGRSRVAQPTRVLPPTLGERLGRSAGCDREASARFEQSPRLGGREVSRRGDVGSFASSAPG